MEHLELKFEPVENPHQHISNPFNKNRLTVFNWLSGIPVSSLNKPFPIVEVSFQQGGRKEFFHNESHPQLKEGDVVVVEGNGGGFDVGEIALTGELVRWQLRKKKVSEDDPNLRRVLRLAGEKELEQLAQAQESEKNILIRSRELAKSQNLDMKITQIEVQADGRKITFFYTATSRVDFRELIKVYAAEFKAKIEMRQIGARQESAKIGGIGISGRELYNSTWMINDKPINLAAVRYQGMPLNLNKIAGANGRVKSCSGFELDLYIDALKEFPKNAETLELEIGVATLQKRDLFRKLMWYSLPGSSKLYPLTIESVEEILLMNQNGNKPEGLGMAELQTGIRIGEPEGRADMGFVNDVGQVSLNSLQKAKNKKNKHKNKTQTDPNKKVQAQANKPVRSPQGGNNSEHANKNRKPGQGNKRGNQASRKMTSRPANQNQSDRK